MQEHLVPLVESGVTDAPSNDVERVPKSTSYERKTTQDDMPQVILERSVARSSGQVQYARPIFTLAADAVIAHRLFATRALLI